MGNGSTSHKRTGKSEWKNPFTYTGHLSVPVSSFVCEFMHTTFYKPAGMAQPAPGAIPSVSYIINTCNRVLRANWGILTGSNLLRTFICCMASPVSYQISLSNHRKIPHLIKLLSNHSDRSPMSWLSEKNVYCHINMKSKLILGAREEPRGRRLRTPEFRTHVPQTDLILGLFFCPSESVSSK